MAMYYLSRDAEINTRIAKAAAVMSKLNRRVWQNSDLTQITKLCVYQSCVLSKYSLIMYIAVRPGQPTQGKRIN